MTIPLPLHVCQECNRPFSFSEDDREFFEARGYQEPTQCRPCRAAGKNRPDVSLSAPVGEARHQAPFGTCSKCGRFSGTIFHLLGHPSAYCRECFDSRRQLGVAR